MSTTRVSAPWTFDPTLERSSYIRELLRYYRDTPTVLGYVRDADRHFASQLYDRRIPLDLMDAALSLAAVRRLCSDPWNPPPPVRSLHYFRGVIDELVAKPPDPLYVRYLKWKLLYPPRIVTEDDGTIVIELWSGIPESRFLAPMPGS
jgi:hypothetical protein